MTLINYGTKVDVRDIELRDRHPLICSTFRSLGVGETLELLNDRDPKPLFLQFQSELPERFSWDYLQAGPDIWRVRIRKLADPHSDGRCCGSCGG